MSCNKERVIPIDRKKCEQAEMSVSTRAFFYNIDTQPLEIKRQKLKWPMMWVPLVRKREQNRKNRLRSLL